MLPAPTAPSEGSAGVRNLVDRALQPTYPLSILAHQLRRRFPSNSSLRGGAGPAYQTARPEGSLVLRPIRPRFSNRSPSKPKPFDVPRPFLGRSLSRPALLTFPTRRSGAASRLRKIDSSGASSRLTPKRTRKLSPLPAGGDRTFGHLPHRLAVADCLARPGPPSRSPVHHAHVSRVAKAKNAVRSLWITGISVTTIGTFSKGPADAPIRLPFRSLPPTSAKCLNLQH